MKRLAFLGLVAAAATTGLAIGAGAAMVTLSIWFAEAVELCIEDLS